QTPPLGNEPALAPAVSGPLETVPFPQERLLAPVPPQFNWLQREAQSNPLLEALLSVQGPAHLIVTTSLTEDVSDNFNHSATNRQPEARRGVVMGRVYRPDDGQNFVSLANTINSFYQVRTGRSQFGYANLLFNGGYQLPPLSFGLSDSLVRGDSSVQDATTP